MNIKRIFILDISIEKMDQCIMQSIQLHHVTLKLLMNKINNGRQNQMIFSPMLIEIILIGLVITLLDHRLNSSKEWATTFCKYEVYITYLS